MPPTDGREVAAIFAGGMLGALLRTALEQAAGADPGAWPWVTFAVNVGGAFVLGVVVTRLRRDEPPAGNRRAFLGTGFCGALTTFSTLQLELLQMIDAGRYGLAAAYAGASVVAGLAAVWLAVALTRRTEAVA